MESGPVGNFYSSHTLFLPSSAHHRRETMGCSIDLQRKYVTTHGFEQEAKAVQDVQQLEKNDFTSAAEMTKDLQSVLQREMVASDKNRNKSSLHFLLKHFVRGSLGTLTSKNDIDEFVVSIGVITASPFFVLERTSETAVSRTRHDATSDVYCWFIPLASVQYRMCLLTVLSVEQLHSMSYKEVVKAIGQGNLGYYAFRRFEYRSIANLMDAQLQLGTNEFVLRRPESDKENHTVVLFSQKSPEFALAQLQVNWKVGFYCDEAIYTDIVIPALAEIPVIREKKLWRTAEFVILPDAPNQLFVIDLDFMVKCGAIDSHLALFNMAKLNSKPPRVMVFDGSNRRTILNRSCWDHFVRAKMNKRNLVYYILVDIINSLSNVRGNGVQSPAGDKIPETTSKQKKPT